MLFSWPGCLAVPVGEPQTPPGSGIRDLCMPIHGVSAVLPREPLRTRGGAGCEGGVLRKRLRRSPGGGWSVCRSAFRLFGLGVETHALGGTVRVGGVTLIRARQDHLVLSGSAITSSDPVGCFLARCAEIHWTTEMFTVRYEGARKRVNSHEDQARNRPNGRLFRDDQPVGACSNGLFTA